MNVQTPASLTIRLSRNDNVAVSRADILEGTAIPAEGVTARTRIPTGHKVATRAIALGEPVVKYDQVIGFATQAIAPGDHVHVHNCGMAEFDRDYAFCAGARPTDMVPEAGRATFQGYRRADGRAGTRNYIGILTSVNCSATVARYIAEAFNKTGILAGYPNIDGVAAFVHSTGCGMADSGDGYDALQRTLWGYARHPNFAGILMVGLGCEVNQIPFLLDAYGLKRGERFQTLTIQEAGGTRRTVDAAIERITAMLPAADAARRETCPASELTLALQCGGSDGYSGITANPALGAAADLLVRHGGTAILSETPEIYGAEHLLTRRAASREVGEKLIARIRWWEDYTKRNGGEMNNNPSPGNKAGGLTTILEKSLGAAAKGGTTNLMGVYKYAEPVTAKGFVFMDSPGYDPCSVTGQVASGANVVCFTTGRGSVFGFKPSPSIKLATNSAMYNRMAEDMDINCGGIADGEKTVAEVGQEIFDKVLAVASGTPSKSEALGFGDAEFIPWQIGAVMWSEAPRLAGQSAEVRVAAAELERFVGLVLAAAGADAFSVEATVRALVGASLRGVDSHGVRLLPHYVKVLQGGRVKGRPQMRFEKRAAAVGRLDAGHALGTAAGYRAMDEAMALAEVAGVGAVSVYNSSHFAAAGAYALAAAEAGYIGMAFCNATSAVLAHGGRDGFHGTNPISFAAPVDGERPYLIDMATSSIPVNRILQYRALDKELPADVVVDGQGRMTQDPHAATSLLPLGGAGYGYKGAALAGMVEILSAALSGMRLGHEMPEMFAPSWSEPRCLGQFFLAMKPAAFIDEAAFQAQLHGYLDALRGQPTVPGEQVMAAGDREWAVERKRSARGIPLDAHNWQVFAGLAEEAGVAGLAVL